MALLKKTTFFYQPYTFFKPLLKKLIELIFLYKIILDKVNSIDP